MAQPSIQDHIAVSNALCAIKPNSHKDVVQKLWQAIVIEWFPPREGYKFAFKGQVMAKDSAAPDAIVIRQVECVQNQQQDEFAEHTPAGWENENILNDLHECGNPSCRIFSAVAIGKKVRFYRFDGKAEQSVLPLHADTIERDLDAPAGLAQVDTMMNQVKQEGYQWTTSLS